MSKPITIDNELGRQINHNNSIASELSCVAAELRKRIANYQTEMQRTSSEQNRLEAQAHIFPLEQLLRITERKAAAYNTTAEKLDRRRMALRRNRSESV
jgi:uncharacterized small protein (DUF1192 family)